MQYSTCRHVKPDGAYCGSPALQNRKYCYYHLAHRGRRLRRARALRDNVPYRLEIPPLDDLASVQFALSEIVQALGAGQLEHRVAGKMLYAIQQTASVIKYRAKFEAAQSERAKAAVEPAQADTTSRVQDYSAFEQEFGINPGTDPDAEIDWTLRKADEVAELRQANDLPTPPLGMRPGSAQYKVYREEAYQSLNMQLNHMRRELRDYYEEKRKQAEKMRQEMLATVGGPHLPSVGKCGEQPEELRIVAEDAPQQAHKQEEKTTGRKKAAASATVVPGRLTGSA